MKQFHPENQHKLIRQVGSDADKDSDNSLTSTDTVKQMGGKVSPLTVIDKSDASVYGNRYGCLCFYNVRRYSQPTKELDVSDIKLQMYSREPLPVVGVRDVYVVHEGQRVSLPLVVVNANGPTLLGRN